MLAARRTTPVNLVGRVAGDIGAELPEIAARSDLAIAVQTTAQTDGRSARLINQLGQSGRKGAGGGNMIMHGGGDQLAVLLQMGQRIGYESLGGKALGAGTIGQTETMAQDRDGKFFDVFDGWREAAKQHGACPACQ